MAEEEKAEGHAAVYGWSTYEDEGFVGAFATPEEALADAHESVGKEEDIYVQEGFYEDVTKLVPHYSCFLENILDAISEKAYEECGEDAAEGWPDISQEAETELTDAVSAAVKEWMKKHLKMPAWTPVGEPMKYPAPPEEG